MRRYYTAESVTEGHPDKVCDQIADAILDECLKHDPSSRVACEVLATRGNVFVAGEISSGYEPPVFDVIRKVLGECGYCTDGIEMDRVRNRARIGSTDLWRTRSEFVADTGHYRRIHRYR